MQNNDTIRIMDITYSSSVDGTGFRDVLFVNFCPHHCEGCHNPETWDKANGRDVSIDYCFERLTESSITNVTFSGGEPMCQADALYELGKRLIEAGKNIWIYSGYTFEEIIKDEKKKRLLSLCTVLVDGKFILAEKGINMRFKGSKNQRILDVQKSLAEMKPILADI